MRSRCLVLVLVLASLGWAPAPAHADPLEHVHSSSRFDRTPASLASLARHVRATRPDVVTWTEVEGARSRTLRRVMGAAHGWRTYDVPGADVAVSWPGREWSLAGARPGNTGTGTGTGWVVLDQRRPPTGAGLRRGPPRRILVTLAHMPSHVEYGDRWRRGEARVATWQAAARAWARELAAVRARRHPDLTLVVADWNINLRRPVWRAVIRAQFPGLQLTWRRPFPRVGTHAAGRLIDATLSDGRGRARLLPRTASSDHRPYAEILR